ncbi:hexosaminidase D-like [Amphiura filiformis]|uniref:hexosaminidase D-like n=1 Tax=Amphiura filiformis TaxID=82378 RepID=UPI003B225CB1
MAMLDETLLYQKPVPVPPPDEYFRLVHFDLKGAPPKMEFLKELFPKLSEWGCNGLLMEYEDMFPYDGKLEFVKSPDAYSMSDIETLQQLAKEYGMEYIPLIQTFGHFEFVLKHDDWSDVRELSNMPTSVCPSNPDSVQRVVEVVDQVFALHTDLKFFHIGADEVFHLGLCAKCRARQDSGLDKSELFLTHVSRVLKYLKNKYPSVTFIMWDDMLRTVSVEQMKAHNLGEMVDPMVWNYSAQDANFRSRFTDDMWSNYAAVFSNVWAASSFKGAFGPTLYWVPNHLHLQNHILWLNEVNLLVPKTLKMRGYALTGWQRYDHFSVLCELLPIGIPCLALALSILMKGAFSHELHAEVSKQLGFSKPLDLAIIMVSGPESNPTSATHAIFPGSEVFRCIQNLAIYETCQEIRSLIATPKETVLEEEQSTKSDAEKRAELEAKVNRLRSKLQTLHDKFWECMSKMYFNRTIEEWIKLRLDPLQSLLDKSLQSSIAGAAEETSKEDKEDQMVLDQPGIDDIS